MPIFRVEVFISDQNDDRHCSYIHCSEQHKTFHKFLQTISNLPVSFYRSEDKNQQNYNS